MTLNELNNKLNEDGIKIPDNTFAAKIIHHQDFDGVFSAIITYNQLIKQGIPAKDITTQWIQYGSTDDEYIDILKKKKGQMTALVDFAKIPDGADVPDFWSDHHKAEKKYGTSSGRTGASEFKSDSHHISLLHTTNLVDEETIKIVDIIDSAGYSNLEDVLKLPKDFKSRNRMERLGILCNALLSDSKILKNNSLLETFIKMTKPSIISFYNNIIEYIRLNNIQEEAIKELRKEHPDWDMIERSRRIMPTQKTKNRIHKGASFNESAIDDYEELNTLKGRKRTREEQERYQQLIDRPLNKIRAVRASSIEKERSKDTTFLKRGSTLIQQNPRLQRYIWTQLNTNGLKYPFIIKRYATFIQISNNPELPQEVRDKIDLGEVANEVMRIVQEKFENKYNSWSFDIINKEKGGHKGITNIPALGTLGLMKKTDREELKYLKSLEKRVRALKKRRSLNDGDKAKLEKADEMLDNPDISELDREYYKKLHKYLSHPMKILMPEKLDRLIELKDKKKYFSKKRTEIMDEIIEEFINQFEKQFGASKEEPTMGDVEIGGGKKEYEFESVIRRLRDLI